VPPICSHFPASCCAFHHSGPRQNFHIFPIAFFTFCSRSVAGYIQFLCTASSQFWEQLIFITFFISPPLIFSIRFILSPAQPFESEPRRPAVGAAEYFGEIYMRNIGGGAHFSNGHGVRRNGGGW